jgi:hypothetical protein
MTDASVDQRIELSLHLNLEKSCYEHNHTLERLDMIKRNDAVKMIAAGEMSKGYGVSEMRRNITGFFYHNHKEILAGAGGKHIGLLDIYNAGRVFRHYDKNKRMVGHKITGASKDLKLSRTYTASDRVESIKAICEIDGEFLFASGISFPERD